MIARKHRNHLRGAALQQRIFQKEIDELTIKAGYGAGRRMARNISGMDRRCRMANAVQDQRALFLYAENIPRSRMPSNVVK